MNLSLANLNNKYLAWGIAFVFTVLILLIIWQDWKIFISSSISNNNHHQLISSSEQATVTASTGHLHCLSCSIQNDHLFGLYNASLQNLPETQLQLSLQGTIDNLETPDRSYAIVASPGQPAKLYKIGQIVPGGAKIQKILKDRIILEDNGTLENLRLPHLSLTNISLPNDE